MLAIQNLTGCLLKYSTDDDNKHRQRNKYETLNFPQTSQQNKVNKYFIMFSRQK